MPLSAAAAALRCSADRSFLANSSPSSCPLNITTSESDAAEAAEGAGPSAGGWDSAKRSPIAKEKPPPEPFRPRSRASEAGTLA